MTVEIGRMRLRAPLSLWVVGALGLLWNGFAAYDFVMTSTQGEAYWRASGMSEAAIAHYNATPIWLYAPWIMGVWGGVIGSLLLLSRSAWAITAFAVSLVGAVVLAIYSYGLSDAAAALGSAVHMSLVIVAVAAFLLWFAWAMRRRRVLG